MDKEQHQLPVCIMLKFFNHVSAHEFSREKLVLGYLAEKMGCQSQ